MREGLFHKLNYILSKGQKIALFFLFSGILFSSFLELIGISSIIPVINMLVNPDTAKDWYIELIQKIFNVTDINVTLTILIIIMIFLYLFKAGFLIFINYCMSKFMMKFQCQLSTRLIKTYLAMPYEFHLQNNSSTLLRCATTDVANFNSMMNAVLQLVMKTIMSISIVTFLFIKNFIITLIVVGILVVVFLFITFVLKPHIRKVGRETMRLSALNYKAITQAFNGVKESKIANKEDYFSEVYEKNQTEINRLSLRNTLYNLVPSTSIETFGMVALMGALLIVKLCVGTGSHEIISQFSLFALATIKLLPNVTGINGNFNTLFYTKTSVDLIYNDIKKASAMEEVLKNSSSKYEKMDFNNEIVAKDVSFSYFGTSKIVLDNVSAVIRKGEFVAFSGISGAGKTTFIDLLLGLLKPTKGTIHCDGYDISENPRGWHENLSYIPQAIYLMDDTIRNNVAFGIERKKIDDQKIWDALEKAQLKTFVESLPNKLDTVIGERGVRLSGGQRQRIGIARALYRDTQIIIFDEATSALDYETEAAIIKCINGFKGEHTMIMITHRLNTIEACDHIYEIVNGKMSLKR